MELNFLGIGSAFNPIMKNTSAYFMHNRSFFLIDCGESVFELAYGLLELRDCEDIYVLITHLHADHVGSLGSLISYCNYVLGKDIHIVHPSEAIVRLLGLMGISRENYRYHQEFPDDSTDIKITAVPVEHVRDMGCYGYLISLFEETIYYSGDALGIPENILAAFLNGKISRCYQDTSTQQSGSHCYIGELERVIPPTKRAMVCCMHLDCENTEAIKAKGFDVAGKHVVK